MLDVPTQTQGNNPFAGLNQRDMDKYFNALKKRNAAERKQAQRTLSPRAIQQAIKLGQIPPHLQAAIGAREDGTPFTIDDLRDFKKSRDRLSKQFSQYVGVTMQQLIALARTVDIQRANTEIKAARLYRVRGDVLAFNVTASQKYDADWHQVRVQLMHWTPAMTQTRSTLAGVKKAVKGAVKFDCGCGRHQFWYRYIATAGGYALTPHEKDFPKVRNPNLVGTCCKHVLKVFQTLQSPTVQNVLAKEMARQAERAGYGSDSNTQFLTQKDIKKLEKARPGRVNQSKAQAEAKKLEQAAKRFMAQLSKGSKEDMRKVTNRQRIELRKKAKALAQREKALQKREEALKKAEANQKQHAKQAVQQHKAKKAARTQKPASQDAIRQKLKDGLSYARAVGIPAGTIYAQMADVNNMSVSAIKQLAKEL